ncbi:class I SAM-dependent methyltransferase [Bosea minatitlanensis]|uniref:Class I SAM-dependent methyltransferase n=1 Tax=Bosea minatitlanensis TaxID=128782 RepID=A0ABW0F9Q2_9HYPH|nr:class I SAM-dependent methyltransferase [Bosea minatitlanensis]MCT4493010.1 class I SAM-dependent methyltransferase [Bosea minatitlanensis]
MIPERLKWTPELVNRFWNGIAQTSLVQLNFAKQAGPSLLAAIKHLLSRQGQILDFGAGDGDLVRLLCEQGFQAAAYEPAEGRISALETSLSGIPGFLGVIGPQAKHLFDVVIMSEVIEHVLDEELDVTLNRLAEFTRPGGTLIITTPNNENLEMGMIYCPVSNQLFHRWQHVRSFNEETLPALLAQFGFEEIVTHRLGFDPAVLLPWDPDSMGPLGADGQPLPIPDYITKLHNNEKATIGSESNLMYVGRRIDS